MPITYRIDHERKLIVARGYGTITDADVFDYQQAAWSGREVAGYAELVDMTDVSDIALPSVRRVQDLASLAARMDDATTPSKFAIVAPTDIAFGLGRMYQTFRESQQRSTKDVGVFRTLNDASAYLELDTAPTLPPLPPLPQGFVTERKT